MARQSVRTELSSSGFEKISSREMPEYGSRASRYRHGSTGCEVFSLANDDPENLFAFAFRTPPSDDTGVAHVLEHSVFCGSKGFPLKDPFVVLLKTSLRTFLNAFTFPDKTVYPASSMVEKDFFNLLRVYADAVFFPLLSEEAFMQEAHHLEPVNPEDPAGDLKRTGVVFNEMKGVFSSPESVVADASLRSLFPDGPYGFEAGGHPREIPGLSLEQLRDFHSRFYHPSNCRIFLYGNIPPERTLGFLEDNFLKHFQRTRIDSSLPPQPRWSEPRRLEATYPLIMDKPQELVNRSTVTVNWLTVPAADPLKLLSFEVLSELLVGNEGAPLHKAMLESKLGHDLSPATGLDTELKELVFTVGLRGTEPDRADSIEGLVLGTLKDLVDHGPEPEAVEAALHRVEFRNREIVRGGRPYSLALMRRALRGWLHDTEPETTLEFRRWMDVLKEKAGQGDYFEELIEEYLLENRHRATVIVRPDPDQSRREAEEERSELESLKSMLTLSEKKEEIRAAAGRLKAFQEQEDSAEVLARIPALHLSDLKREVERIPTERIFPVLGVPVLFHDLFTAGIVYFDLAFEVNGLSEESSRFLPLFSRVVRGSGLPGVPYYDVARRLSVLTGGFGAVLSADTPVASADGARQQLIFRVKMLENNLQPALALVRDLLTRADFRDLDRLKTNLLEMRNDLKASLVPGGSHYASLRAGSRLSRAIAVEESWQGISQYLWLLRTTRDLDAALPDIALSLEALREALFSSPRLTLNVTCRRGALVPLARAAADLLEALAAARGLPASDAVSALQSEGAEPPQPQPAASEGRLPLPRESMPQTGPVETVVGSMNVSFVAHAIPAAAFGSPENAQEAVLAHYLGTGFLWQKIRMKGGAYGAAASANGLEALFTFSSYRDPNFLETRQAFREALSFAAGQTLSDEEFEKIVLGAAGKEEKPLAPGEKGFVALKRELLGIDDETRQARRDSLIDCSAAEMRAAAGRLLADFDRGSSVLLSHQAAAEKAAKSLRELEGTTVELPE